MIQKDIFGREPKVGDTIAFNPPKYKGLMFGKCIGFTKAGCPMLNEMNYKDYRIDFEIKNKGYYSVKTEFVIK